MSRRTVTRRLALLGVGLVAGASRLAPPAQATPPPMLAPPVWVFVLPSSVAGGTTTTHTHHATHTTTAPFPVTYSYTVAVRAPASLAYTIEIYALALHAQRAAEGQVSSLPPLRLPHPSVRGEWLRGVVTAHYCALVVGAAYRNLLLSVNTAHPYTGRTVSRGCQHDLTVVLALERHLLGRAAGFAAQR